MQKKFAMAIAAIFAVASSQSYAASTTGTATVNILKATTLTKTADLDFGKIAPGTSSATARINFDDTRTCSSGLTCLGKASAGAFDVTGSTGETLSVTLANTDVTLTQASGEKMKVSLALNSAQVTLVNGKGQVKVGGTLSIGALQAGGVYSGLFELTVDYR
jgi:Mat/Ecp fimbriae major subunit